MSTETIGGPATAKPWFAPQSPWAFWGAPSSRKMINNGCSPQALLAPDQRQLGFAVSPSFSVGTNAMRDGPATVGNVLNLSAAAMGSQGAFRVRGGPDSQ